MARGILLLSQIGVGRVAAAVYRVAVKYCSGQCSDRHFSLFLGKANMHSSEALPLYNTTYC